MTKFADLARSAINSGGSSAFGSDHRAMRLGSAIHAGLIGDHVDHHRTWRARGCSRAAGLPTATAQPIGPTAMAPMHRRGAGCGYAGRRHIRGGDGVQSRIDRVGVGGDQPANISVKPSASPRSTLPVRRGVHDDADRITVGAGHNPVHVTAQSALRYPQPPRDLHRQLRSTAASTSES